MHTDNTAVLGISDFLLFSWAGLDRYAIAAMAVLLRRAGYLHKHPPSRRAIDLSVACAFMLTVKMVSGLATCAANPPAV